MALPVTISITCGGTSLAHGGDYSSLTLTQDLFGAHVLTITAPFDQVESTRTPFFAKAPDRLLGQPVAAQLQAVPGFGPAQQKPLLFKGMVTGLSTGQDSDQTGSVQVTVHSTDYLLTDGLQRRTFRQQTLRQIFAAVLQPYDVPHQLKPHHTAPLPYVVQYQECNFDFLSRLAATYGEWFYSDGRTLRLGPPPAEAEIAFAADGTYNRFSFGLALRPTQAKLYGYDYRKHQHTSATTANQAVAGLQRNQYGRLVLEQSDKMFPHPAHALAESPDPTTAVLTAEAKRLKGQLAASLVSVQGQSENPALTLGSVVNITGKGLGSNHAETDSFGIYRLTALTHSVDVRGNYRNAFTAIPHQLDEPPVSPHHNAPAGTPEPAEVIDGKDPDNLGRIRVRYPWPVAAPQDAETDWLRVMTPYSGAGKGQLFTPEVGSQVMVAYAHGLAEQPYVQGNLFHGQNEAGAKYTHNGGEVKGFQTMAGNRITFHDKKGAEKIVITSGKQKDTAIEISFKGKGKIEIKTQGDLSFTAGQNVSIQAGKKLSLKAGELTMQAKSIQGKADSTVELAAASAELKMAGAATQVKGSLTQG